MREAARVEALDEPVQRRAARRATGEVLGPKHEAELRRMPAAEGAVARERLLARAVAGQRGAQLATEREREIEGGADPLGRQRQAVPGRVADEEDAVLGGRTELVRDPVTLE